MKKNLTIIASAVLALGMLFVTGCKNEPKELGDDKVKAADVNLSGEQYKRKLRITAEEYPIDWWVLTDTNKVVLQPGVDFDATINVVKENEDVVGNDIVNYKGTIAKNNTIEITFTDAFFNNGTQKEIYMYIRQPERPMKDSDKKDVKDKYTGLGSAKVSTETGRKTTDKRIMNAGFVAPIATVQVTCNETGLKDGRTEGGKVTLHGTECTVRNWHGDYKITELWPMILDKSINKYVAYQGLKFVNLGVEEGKTVEVIYPANVKSFFAIKQPDRFDKIKDKDADEAQASFYWCFGTELQQYKTYKVSSSMCTFKFDGKKVTNKSGNTVELPDNVTVSANAISAPYFIDPSEFVEAGDIK